jgi:hypothetical protein
VYELSKDQVDFILEDVRRNGIKTEELQLSLLDHICCVIENEMSPDKNFDDYYRSVLPRFFKKELKEIQEETDLLLTFKHYYAMKKVMLRSGMFSAITFAIGAIFKIMHWPGASVLLQLAIISISFIFLPIFFLIKSKEVKAVQEKFIIGFGVVFGILFCISTLFKIMHWPGASFMWLLALGVLFFLFLPVFFFSGIRNPETKMNTILSSIMVLIAGGLLFTLTAIYGAKYKEEAIEIADSHLKNVTIFASSSLDDKSIKIEIDSLVRIELEQKTEKVLNNISEVRNSLYKYLGEDKSVNEEELLMDYRNDYLSCHQFFFKSYTRNPENDLPKEILIQLKKELKTYQSYVNQNFKISSKLILNLDNQNRTFDGKSVKTDWEHVYFSVTPFETIVRNLNQLEIDIRLIEASCI